MSDTNDNKKGFGVRQFQRNRYFYGKLMSVRDFETEQSYMNEKRHLLNRMIDGFGIVCGLALEDVEISVAEGNIKIKFNAGGTAIDRLGREIVVPIELGLRDVLVEAEGTKSNLTLSEVAAYPYYLYLEYDQREGELVSSALENSSCEETCCPNRIIEDFQVVASRMEPEIPTISCRGLSVTLPRMRQNRK